MSGEGNAVKCSVDACQSMALAGDLNPAQFRLIKSSFYFSKTHFVLSGPFNAVFVWNDLSDDADLHPFRNEHTDALDAITNVERRHGGTSYVRGGILSCTS